MANITFALTADVVHARGKKLAHKRGFETVTVVLLKFGPVVLGSTKLPGKYSPEQALTETKKNPGRLKLRPEAREVTDYLGLTKAEPAPAA